MTEKTSKSLEIVQLGPENEEAYAELFRAAPENLFYASPHYLAYLRNLLRPAQDRTFLAMRDGAALGALPCFVSGGGSFGPVMNSLPYYGSNAGLLLRPDTGEEASLALLRAWEKLARDIDAAAWTIIENPLNPMAPLMDKVGMHAAEDQRIGQFTPLYDIRVESAPEQLLALYHQKARNMVRKFHKTGLGVARDESERGLRTLYLIHKENMEALGGAPKPEQAFLSLPAFFQTGREYRVYLAKDGAGDVVAGLLVFFCNRTAEYYTPAVKLDFRHMQPVSGLIYEAMQDAVSLDMEWWNWGGTWLSQEGVYRFKSRWGTQDRRYKYYVSIRKEKILQQSPETLQGRYPFFYVRPY